MPTKKETRVEVNTFVQGLITEASPLNFPANASSNEENFILNRDGSRQRRLGMDLEPGTHLYDSTEPYSLIRTVGVNTFTWSQVKGSTFLELTVVQTGNLLSFFDNSKENMSADGYKGFLKIDIFPQDLPFSFAAIEGFLVVVASIGTFAVISYNEATQALTLGYDRIFIRDLFGVQSAVDLYETDASYRGPLEPLQYYNLQNQSWGIPRKNAADILVDPILNYESSLGKAPSNSEQVWLGMQFQAATPPAVPSERQYINLYEDTLGSTTTAAKGYYIIDALERGASRAFYFANNRTKYPILGYYTSGVVSPYINPNFKTDITEGGPSCVAAFAGRVFYSGFNGSVVDGDSRSPNYGDFVFYSQLVKNSRDFNRCYQEGDPTSREGSDVVDTDGGFVKISGANNIISLVPLATSLVVVAKNGIWTVTGGSDYGFTATNIKVNKVSAYGGTSRFSIVVDGDRMFYWSNEGIFLLARNQLGDFSVESISLGTIQTFYDAISSFGKETCKGFYDTEDKKIKWLYRSGWFYEPGTVHKELVLDTTLNSFSVNRIGATEDWKYAPAGLFKTDFGTKYLTLVRLPPQLTFSFSAYTDEQFIDWRSEDGVGVDAKAFCFTGYQTGGDSAVNKQIPYLIMHFKKTEKEIDNITKMPKNPSGCLMQCRWGFTNGPQSNKWTNLQQVYRDRRMFYPDANWSIDNGYDLLTSKTKIRGEGKAFSMYLETEPKKDCKIIGWSITLNANSIT